MAMTNKILITIIVPMIEEEYDIYIKNLEQEIIYTIRSSESGSKKIEIVK